MMMEIALEGANFQLPTLRAYHCSSLRPFVKPFCCFWDTARVVSNMGWIVLVNNGTNQSMVRQILNYSRHQLPRVTESGAVEPFQ